MQTKWRESSSENQEFLAQLQVYKGTQEELTSELSDFKEKYQEVVDLLRDSQNELKNLNKKSYSGLVTRYDYCMPYIFKLNLISTLVYTAWHLRSTFHILHIEHTAFSTSILLPIQYYL